MEIHKNPSKLMDAHSPSCNIHTLVFMIGVMQVLLDQVFTTPKSHRRELQPHPIFMSWNLSKLVSNVSTKNKKTQKKQGHHGVRSSFPSSKSLHTHTHTNKHIDTQHVHLQLRLCSHQWWEPSCHSWSWVSDQTSTRTGYLPKNRCFLTAKLDALRR